MLNLTDDQYYRIVRIVVGRYCTPGECDRLNREKILEEFAVLLTNRNCIATYLTLASFYLRSHESFNEWTNL